MDIEALIEKFGGVRSMGRKLEVDPMVVSYWRKVKKIPRWREHEIREAARRYQINIAEAA